MGLHMLNDVDNQAPNGRNGQQGQRPIRRLGDYITSNAAGYQFALDAPEIDSNNFDSRTSLIQMVTSIPFYGNLIHSGFTQEHANVLHYREDYEGQQQGYQIPVSEYEDQQRNTLEESNIENMLAEFLVQQKKHSDETDVRIEKLLKTVEQLAIQSRFLEIQLTQQSELNAKERGIFLQQPDPNPTSLQMNQSWHADDEDEVSEIYPLTSDEALKDLLEHPIEYEKDLIYDDARRSTYALVMKEQEECVHLPILLEVYNGDPFLISTPPSKFECFNPFIVKLDNRSTDIPLVLQTIIHRKRMGTHLKVHCRLDGRKFKWDFKVD